MERPADNIYFLKIITCLHDRITYVNVLPKNTMTLGYSTTGQQIH